MGQSYNGWYRNSKYIHSHCLDSSTNTVVWLWNHKKATNILDYSIQKLHSISIFNS
jgi:hypothetical protein